MVCVFFLAADFSKYALGFFQLASMAELAVVVGHSAKQLRLIQSTDTLLLENSQNMSFGAHCQQRPSLEESLQNDTPASTEQNEDQDLLGSFRDRRGAAESFDLEAAALQV